MKYLFFGLCLFIGTMARALPYPIPYEVQYGPDAFYDLTGQPVLKMVRQGLLRADLFGNLPNESGIKNGIRRLFYRNGNVLMLAPVRDGVLNGLTRYFYPNGTLLLSLPYTNGALNGKVALYHRDGNIKMRQTYENGQPTGTGVMYHNNGRLALSQSHQNGKIEGMQVQYYRNGTLKSQIPFSNGLRNGTVKLFYENGRRLAELTYENDRLTENKCWTPNSNPSRLNQIEIYKFEHGFSPVYCIDINEQDFY